MFKRSHAAVLLAKGKMEQDYLVRVCGIPRQRVEIGAPILLDRILESSVGKGEKPFIVFFSEAYEMTGGRARDFYRDILPSLADLAMSEGRELIIKLHPSESPSDRSRIIDSILRPEQKRVMRIISGALQPELLNDTWFGITVLSTVVVECALRGIPCFLCAWLESWPYGYIDQFARFEVGVRLKEPAEIKQIPATVRSYKASPIVGKSCWIPIKTERLQNMLGIGRKSESTKRPEREEARKISMNMGTLLVRADASIAIGTGHVMRCLALAQAVAGCRRPGGFAMAETTPAIQATIAAEACEVVSISAVTGTAEDAKETIDVATEGEV